MVGTAQLVEHLVVVQEVAGSSPVTHPRRVRCELSTKGPTLGRGFSLAHLLCLRGPTQCVGMEAGDAQPVVRVAVADAQVVVLVDVDRLEQRLIDEPTVRIVGVLVDVGGVGQQFQ